MSALRNDWVAAALAAAAIIFFALPQDLLAQNATLTGMVVSDADGAALSNVLVALDSGQRARTDKDGSFRLKDVPPGPHRVALVAAGCQITFASIEPRAGQEASVAFQMEYDPDVVAAAKRAAAGGRVVGAEEIRKMRARDLSDVLAKLSPGMVAGASPQPGQDAYMRSRRTVSVAGATQPAVILDGSLLSSGFAGFSDIPLSDVAWIQVSRGASGGWEVGTGGSGGLIRIQTKRGVRMDQPFADPAHCEIPGWVS